MKPSRSEFVQVRQLRYHVRHWGEPGAPQLFMLHGWMDVAATFQFLVDALGGDWHVIAPDWRGYGQSEWRGEPYWFPDYLADLDALLRHYSPDRPVCLIGHSMGGNVACLFAGVRPERVARLVTIEGFGLAPSDPGEAPARYRRWLDELQSAPRFRGQPSPRALAERLQQGNPRLSAERAAFLAEHLGIAYSDGQIVPAGDPWHRLVNPVLYRIEEAAACWRAVTAPVLWIGAAESTIVQRSRVHPEDYRARLACFAALREVIIENAGHMVHRERPEAIASLIEEFVAAPSYGRAE